MARFIAVIGLCLGVAGHVATAYAAEELDQDTIDVAAEAGVDPWDLLGATNTTGLDPRTYLITVGELIPPVLSLRDYAYVNYPATAWCIERIATVESNGWYTYGWNRIPVGRASEHASGLGGFLPSTWASTPEAGESIWDGEAQIRAIDWMLRHRRGTEFAAVSWGRCRGLLGMY